MRGQRIAIFCLLAFQYIACGGNGSTSPTGPEQPSARPIAGVWKYAGDNFPEGLAGRLYTCLIDQEQYDEETASGLVRITLGLMDLHGMTWPWIAFNDDGTFTFTTAAPESNAQRVLQVGPLGIRPPRSGTWTVSGAQLILIEDGNTTTRSFSVSGAQLEFSYPAQAFKNSLNFGYSRSQDPTVIDNVTNARCLDTEFSGIEHFVFCFTR